MRLWLISALILAMVMPGFGQTDLIYPWVTNNATFGGTVVVNNLNSESVEVTMTATRQDGSSETITQTLGALEQLVSSSTALFQTLGEGSGYTIHLTSSASNITGGFVVTGTQSASGTSPSQANVFAASEASNIILYNYFSNASGFSAPVVVNMGSSTASVTFHVFSQGVKTTYDPVTIEAGRPLAGVTTDLFPDISGDFYLVAESDQPILGVAFIFNDLLEPSMANATPISTVPEGSDGGGDQVSFVDQIIPIIQGSCGTGNCHLNGSAAAGLNLDGNPYDSIVNVNSNQGTPYITPNEPAQSYLYLKLLSPSEASYLGSRMPRGGAPLSDENLTLIRTWIEQGANR